MKYSWLTMFQMHSKVIQLYKHTYIIFEIIFHHRLLQDIHHSSLCYTVNFCCLLHYLFFRLFVTPWTVDHQSLSLRPHGLLPARLLCPGRFSRQEYWGSSQPRDWTQVFHTAGRFFTVWATREAHQQCLPAPSLRWEWPRTPERTPETWEGASQGGGHPSHHWVPAVGSEQGRRPPLPRNANPQFSQRPEVASPVGSARHTCKSLYTGPGGWPLWQGPNPAPGCCPKAKSLAGIQRAKVLVGRHRKRPCQPF